MFLESKAIGNGCLSLNSHSGRHLRDFCSELDSQLFSSVHSLQDPHSTQNSKGCSQSILDPYVFSLLVCFLGIQ